MPRVDVWDLAKARETPLIDAGFDPMDGFDERFTWGRQLGKGGFGNVRVVIDKRNGTEFACKSIPKRLDAPGLAPERQAAHVDNIRREVAVLRRLRGTLNVVALEGAFEDADSAHIVMELCRGGELLHAIAHRPHYSEMTVASFMRAVLRTLAQCHAHRILHRDVKPGNFMLLSEAPDAPLKAIDFGLAAFFDPAKLPRSDLGLEGTPWFMAPEVLSSRVGPEADVWSAGVMAYQLLCGRLPFDDAANPDAPALSVIWKGILAQQPSFRGTTWGSISDRAKDFVGSLLKKDPRQRPSAREALAHPWVLGGDASARALGAPLRASVVQRIQRFGQANPLRRTIFELIAAEILKMQPPSPSTSPDSSTHGGGSGMGGSAMTGEDGGGGEGGEGAAAALRGAAAAAMAPPGGALASSSPGSPFAAAAGTASARLPKSTSAGDLLRAVRGEAAAAGRASFESASSGGAGGGGGGGGGGGSLRDASAFLLPSSFGSAGGGGGGGFGGQPHFQHHPGTQSAHGGGDYWRIMRAAAAAHRLAARVEGGAGGEGGSLRGGGGGASAVAAAAAVARGLQRLRLSRARGDRPPQEAGGDPSSPATAAAASMDLEGGGGDEMETEANNGKGATAAAELGEPGLFYARTAPRSERERAAARKAARLALDTSAHDGAGFARLVRAFEDEAREASVHGGGSLHGALAGRRRSGEMTDEGELRHKPAGSGGGGGGGSGGGTPAPSSSLPAAAAAPPLPSNSLSAVAPSLPSASPVSPTLAVEMGGRRQQGAYAAFMANASESSGGGGGGAPPPLPQTAMQLSTPPSPSVVAEASAAGRPSADGRKQVTFSPVVASSLPAAVDVPAAAAAAPRPARTAADPIAAAGRAPSGGGRDGGAARSPSPPAHPLVSLRELRDVMRALNFSRGDEAVTASALADGLARLGYELEPSEARVLAEQVAPAAPSSAAAAAAAAPQQERGLAPSPSSSLVPKAAFVASQLDWGSIATNYRDQWLAAAEKVFGDLRQQAGGGGGGGGGGEGGENDGGGASLLPASALTAALRDKLPAAEVAHAVEDALLATGAADTEALDFEGFLRMLRCGGVAAGVGEQQGGGSVRGGGGCGGDGKVEGSVHAGLEFFDSRYRGAPQAQAQQAASPSRVQQQQQQRRPSGEYGVGLSGLDPVAE